MLSYSLGGQTQDARSAYIENARENEIISVEQIDNPARPGFKMRVIKLNRDNPIVKEILLENDLGGFSAPQIPIHYNRLQSLTAFKWYTER